MSEKFKVGRGPSVREGQGRERAECPRRSRWGEGRVSEKVKVGRGPSVREGQGRERAECPRSRP